MKKKDILILTSKKISNTPRYDIIDLVQNVIAFDPSSVVGSIATKGIDTKLTIILERSTSFQVKTTIIVVKLYQFYNLIWTI